MSTKRRYLRDVWACWACLSWWPRSEPSLRDCDLGNQGEAKCPGCGEEQLILFKRGVKQYVSNR